MFSKKKKKPQISLPSNFEHRVHTGFDKKEGRYIGLPLQWASIVGNNQILKSSNRPMPVSVPPIDYECQSRSSGILKTNLMREVLLTVKKLF